MLIAMLIAHVHAQRSPQHKKLPADDNNNNNITSTRQHALVLIEINHHPSGNLTPPQLLYALCHLTQAPHLLNRSQQATFRVVQARRRILHGADKRADDVEIGEDERAGLGAHLNLTGGWQGDAHDAGPLAGAGESDGVWRAGCQ